MRYRKNVRSLPGTPDIVLKKYRTVVFVNGCFWHHHDCGRFVWPATNTEYWRKKIDLLAVNFIKSQFPDVGDLSCRINEGKTVSLGGRLYGMYLDENEELYLVDNYSQGFLYSIFTLVGIGTLVHSTIDFVISLGVWKILVKANSVAAISNVKKLEHHS